jgi:hypothetical protein
MRLIEGNIIERDILCSGTIDLLPLIKLSNNSFLKIPCEEEGGGSLLKLAKKAPHGRGEKTLLDKNVRDAWEIDGRQLKICTEDWNSLMNGNDSNLLDTIKTKLAPDTQNIRAELYKLLIYEKGNHFIKHQDTQRNKHHFASLVIFLPSVYTGGDLVISHQNYKERSFNFSLTNKDEENKPLQCNYVAFYTDCHHEIKPLKSGLRVTLTYNLFFKGSKVPRPLVMSAQQMITEGVHAAFEEISDKSLGIFLNHQYSIQTAHPNLLKGKDSELFKLFSGLTKDQYELTVEPVQISFTGSAGDDEDSNGAFGLLQEAIQEGYEVDIVVSSLVPKQEPKTKTKAKRTLSSLLGITSRQGTTLSEFELGFSKDQTGSVIFINPDSLIDRLSSLDADHEYGTPTGNEGTQFDLQYTLAAIFIRRKNKTEIIDDSHQSKRKKAKLT